MRVFLLGLLLLTGCRHHYLVVYNDYICKEQFLASSYVDTPDWRQCTGWFGQRLVIKWRLPKGSLYGHHGACLLLTVRYRSAEVETYWIPMTKVHGTWTYWLMNDEYLERDGILTYKVEMVVDNEVIDTWEHQIWTELIQCEV